MQFVSLDAYAKINWSLAVQGRREDGYHLLDMLLQSVSLCDTIELSASGELSLTVGGKVPVKPEFNLCIKAANAFYLFTGIKPGCAINLIKRIPVCAGMGGGSADAAGVLTGLNILHQTRLKNDELAVLALSLGADVPFMLKGGLMRARGIGEQLTPLKLGCRLHLVILMPSRGASTREIFSAFDAQRTPLAIDNDSLCSALEAGDVSAAAKLMRNHLQPVTAGINQGVDTAVKRLNECGALAAVMTGSGSACFGVFRSESEAASVCRVLQRSNQYRVYCVSTVSSALRLRRIC